MKKIYVGSDNKVALVCPGCEKTKVVDVSKYLNAEGTAKLTYRLRCDECDCGHKNCNECLRQSCSQGYVNTVQLERRKHVRKDTLLLGKVNANGGALIPVQVLDISRTGARVRVAPPAKLEVGKNVVLDFQLDDRQKTSVKKEGKVVREAGFIAGLLFHETETYSTSDKAIGFYLMK
jgi:hypothetical protein